MKLNTVLHTKNGKFIGNAIIVSVTETENYLIKTDYGNVLSLNVSDIKKYFNIGEVSVTHKYAIIEN